MDLSAIKNKHGFTLIEFVFAIIIIMVGLLALLQTINYAIASRLGNQYRNEAIVVADETLAAQLAKGSGSGFALISTVGPRSTSINRTFLGVFKSYSVTTTGISTTANTKEIDVTVSWTYKQVRYVHNAASLISQNQ